MSLPFSCTDSPLMATRFFSLVNYVLLYPLSVGAAVVVPVVVFALLALIVVTGAIAVVTVVGVIAVIESRCFNLEMTNTTWSYLHSKYLFV